MLPQHAQAEPRVLPRRLSKVRTARLAALLADALQIAEAPTSSADSLLRRQARRDILRRALLDMEPYFFVNLPLHFPPMSQRAEFHPGCAQNVHGFTPSAKRG